MSNRYNTNWDGVRVTDSSAAPVLKHVEGARVVFIKEGSIRGAEFKNARFLLPDGQFKSSQYGTKQRVEVQCLWYGRKPPSSWMNVTCRTKPIEEKDFTGQVIFDFNR